MAPRLSLKLRGHRAPEPTSRVPLTWGDPRGRELIGSGLIVLGGALIAQTGAFTMTLGLLGSVLHGAGWLAVRRRPLFTWLLTAVPLVTALALGGALPFVADKPIVFAGTGVAVALSALAARELALRVRIRVLAVHRASTARIAPVGDAASVE